MNQFFVDYGTWIAVALIVLALAVLVLSREKKPAEVVPPREPMRPPLDLTEDLVARDVEELDVVDFPYGNHDSRGVHRGGAPAEPPTRNPVR